MPTWGELLKELKTLQEAAAERPAEFGDQSPFDVQRRRYMRALNARTGRAVIVYGSGLSIMIPRGIPRIVKLIR